MTRQPPDLIREVPVAFISYTWEDESHRQWVIALGTRLRSDGVDLVLDEWHLRPGMEAPKFMEKAVAEADRVLLVCTPQFKAKVDERSGGAGYEANLVTAEMMAGAEETKFIPILRRGAWREAAPKALLGKIYIDLSGDPYSESSYEVLKNALFGRHQPPPPLGAALTTGEPVSPVRLERERLFADYLNAAMRVSQAARNRRMLLKKGNLAARIILEKEVEPELKEQAQRVADMMQRIMLVSSEELSKAAGEIAGRALGWQLSVFHPEGEKIHQQEFEDFLKKSVPRYRDAVRKELAAL